MKKSQVNICFEFLIVLRFSASAITVSSTQIILKVNLIFLSFERRKKRILEFGSLRLSRTKIHSTLVFSTIHHVKTQSSQNVEDIFPDTATITTEFIVLHKDAIDCF